MERGSCGAIYDVGKKVLVLDDGHTFARGLTKTLAACFSPSLNTEDCFAALGSIKRKKQGMQIGMQLDLVISHWVSDPNFEYDCPRFRMVQQILKDKEWTPVSTQVALGCNTLRVGTLVDLVCRDRDGATVLVELKCGFDDYYDVANEGVMNFPFQDLPLTFRNRHYVQLWITAWLFHHCFPTTRIGTAVILHVFADPDNKISAQVTSLPTWLFVDTDRLKECLLVLRRTRHETKKKRMAQIRRAVKRVTKAG